MGKPMPGDSKSTHKHSALDSTTTNHYQTLGLDYDCTGDDIRAAYRFLAKQHHPDVNRDSPDARLRTQELVAANEILSNPKRRSAYDRSLKEARLATLPTPSGKIDRDISQDVHVKIEDFFRGSKMAVRVRDPANLDGAETYEFTIAPMTAPGTRLRLPRSQNIGGGFVRLKLKALPGFQFKARGSDLRCDLNITSQLATRGGTQTIKGPIGNALDVEIPPNVPRGELIRIADEGLPNSRGGRGDLLVRIIYRPDVRVICGLDE